MTAPKELTTEFKGDFDVPNLQFDWECDLVFFAPKDMIRQRDPIVYVATAEQYVNYCSAREKESPGETVYVHWSGKAEPIPITNEARTERYVIEFTTGMPKSRTEFYARTLTTSQAHALFGDCGIIDCAQKAECQAVQRCVWE